MHSLLRYWRRIERAISAQYEARSSRLLSILAIQTHERTCQTPLRTPRRDALPMEVKDLGQIQLPSPQIADRWLDDISQGMSMIVNSGRMVMYTQHREFRVLQGVSPIRTTSFSPLTLLLFNRSQPSGIPVRPPGSTTNLFGYIRLVSSISQHQQFRIAV